MFSGLIGYRGALVSAEPRGRRRRALADSLRRRQARTARGEGLDRDRRRLFDRYARSTGKSSRSTSFRRRWRARRSVLRNPGDVVNVEYSLRVGDRMGGHFVYGHVDATAEVLARTPEGQGERVRIERPAQLAPMIAEKAFIAVDGVSFTVAAVGDGLVRDRAHSRNAGTHDARHARPAGSRVNLEVDPLARYVVEALKR